MIKKFASPAVRSLRDVFGLAGICCEGCPILVFRHDISGEMQLSNGQMHLIKGTWKFFCFSC